MIKARTLILILMVMWSISDVEAQRRKPSSQPRFAAGIIGGLNFSQIDGDNYTGYDKRSLFGGFQAIARLNDLWSLNVNFLFVTKGAHIENEFIEFKVRPDKDRRISFKYAEVPFMIRLNPHGNTSIWYFEGGLSFSKMLDSDITERVQDFTEIVFSELVEDFKRSEWSTVWGAGVKASKKISIGMRFTYGINKFYLNEAPTTKINPNIYYPKEILFLRNYYISLVASYRVF